MTISQTEQLLVQKKAGRIVSYPPQLVRLSSVTVRLRLPNHQMPDAGVAADVDQVDVLLSGAAAAGDTSIELSGDADVVEGRYYLVIDDTTGRVQPVRALRSGTISTFQIDGALALDAVDGSRLLGYAVVYDVPADQTDSYGRGVAWWEGQATVELARTAYFSWAQDVRVTPRTPAPPVLGPDVEALSPYAALMKPPDDPSLQRTIAAAWALHVLPALAALGIAPEMIVSWEPMTAWIVAAVETHLAENYDQNNDVKERKLKTLATMQKIVLSGTRFWIDEGSAIGTTLSDVSESTVKDNGYGTTFCTR